MPIRARITAPIAWSVAALLFGLPLADPAQDNLTDREQILQLEMGWNQAHLDGDADALAELWAEDFEVIVPRMAPLSRADALRARTGPLARRGVPCL